MRRFVLTAIAGAAAVGAAVPSFAGTLPVTVYESTNGGVYAGVDVLGRPGVGASVANGEACVGVSLQVPQCATVPPVTIRTPAPAAPAASRQQLPVGPVVLYHDSTRTAVGVGDVGVVVYGDGMICPVVSTQDWRCVQLG